MIDWKAYEAVLFDLDGVLTATAKLHAASWKRMFDDYLERRATGRGEPFRPFEMPGDYLQFVDGRPRYDGVRAFLASRGITLEDGVPDNPPGLDTVCGLGNRKNAIFGGLLSSAGVEVYAGSLTVVRQLLRHGVRCAVVSSSRSCEAILHAAGLADLFELRVDGQVAARQGLAGKPAPDTFAYAARVLGVLPARAVVVEDAIAGVKAARAGGFGLVVAIDRTGEPAALHRAGADLVVGDLGDTLPDGDKSQGGSVTDG